MVISSVYIATANISDPNIGFKFRECRAGIGIFAEPTTITHHTRFHQVEAVIRCVAFKQVTHENNNNHMNINKNHAEIVRANNNRTSSLVFIMSLLVCALLFPWNQPYAARGDLYVVVVTSGKVRGGPAKTYPLVGSVFKGHELVEIDRRAGWVNVRSTSKAIEGWIHSALLARKKTPPKKTPRVAPRQASHAEALTQFNLAFSKLRGKLKDEQGKEFFGAVTSKGNGVIHINVTSAWISQPGWQKEADIKQLFSMWYTAYNRRPAAVYIQQSATPLPAAMYARDQSGKDHIAVRD